MLSPLYHAAVLLLPEERLKIRLQTKRYFGGLLSLADQLLHGLQLQYCLVVVCLYIVGLDVDDQNDLLSVVVKGYHLVKQHQVGILKAILILRIQLKGRLTVLDVVIREIPHQSSGKGGQVVKLGTLVFLDDTADPAADILPCRLSGKRGLDGDGPVVACDLQQWVIP